MISNPPQRPVMVGSRFGLSIIPGSISSATDVNMIGASAVPSASSIAPRAIIRAVALDPVPASPFTITPGSIVKVTPSTTAIRDFRI
jgi:hypothetical protein